MFGGGRLSFSDYIDKSRKENQKKDKSLLANQPAEGVWSKFWGIFSKKKPSAVNQKFSNLAEEVFDQSKLDLSEELIVDTQDFVQQGVNEIDKEYLELEDLEKIPVPIKNISGRIHIELYVQHGYLTLFLYPPKENIEAVNITETFLNVHSLLLLQGVQKKDIELKDCIRRALKEEVFLSLKQLPPNLARDSTLIFSFSEDNCFAFLEITKPYLGGIRFVVEEIKNAIALKRITYGLILESIDLAVKKEIYEKKILIAKGKLPIHGIDEKLDYKVPVEGKGFAKIKDDGTIDFREINFTTNVVEGQILVEKISGAPAVDGMSIFGKKILGVPGKIIELLAGENVTVSEDGKNLVALANGNATKDKITNSISVGNVLLISGDVGPVTGNVRHAGSIEVLGSVLDGYELYSDSNILVRGTIGSAKVKSTENLEVQLGIIGKGKSEISCGGDLFCKFMQDSLVTVSGNLYVEEFIIRCEVDCEQGVYLNIMRKASIIGGRVSATHTILSNTIGSPGETGTKLQVGINPILERQYKQVLEKYKEVEKERLDKESFLKRMDEMSLDTVMKKDGTSVNKEDIILEISKLEILFENLRGERDFSLKKMKNSQSETEGVIRINKLMYGGTDIICNGVEAHSKTDMQGPFLCQLNKISREINFKGIIL